jgi:hypothetical protein
MLMDKNIRKKRCPYLYDEKKPMNDDGLKTKYDYENSESSPVYFDYNYTVNLSFLSRSELESKSHNQSKYIHRLKKQDAMRHLRKIMDDDCRSVLLPKNDLNLQFVESVASNEALLRQALNQMLSPSKNDRNDNKQCHLVDEIVNHVKNMALQFKDQQVRFSESCPCRVPGITCLLQSQPRHVFTSDA